MFSPKFPPMPRLCTHSELGGLDAAQGGPFLHHEAQQPRQDGGHRPRRVPRVGVEIRDGQAQPAPKTPQNNPQKNEDLGIGEQLGWEKLGFWEGSSPCVAFEPSIGGDHINTGRFEGEFSREYQLAVVISTCSSESLISV